MALHHLGEGLMAQRRIVGHRTLTDSKTGETLNAITIIPRSDDKDYTKVFQLFASKVLMDINTMNVEAKILLWLLSQRAMAPMQASGWICCQQGLLAEAIGVTRVSINRAMARLADKSYIEQQGPKSQNWRIKPDLCFRGSLHNYWHSKPGEQPTDIWDPWTPEQRMKKLKKKTEPSSGAGPEDQELCS